MTAIYIILTIIFVALQLYMLRCIKKRGNEALCWKKSCELAEERENNWYKKFTEQGIEYGNFRQKFYIIQNSRYRLAAAIAKKRIAAAIKKEAQEIIEE